MRKITVHTAGIVRETPLAEDEGMVPPVGGTYDAATGTVVPPAGWKVSPPGYEGEVAVEGRTMMMDFQPSHEDGCTSDDPVDQCACLAQPMSAEAEELYMEAEREETLLEEAVAAAPKCPRCGIAMLDRDLEAGHCTGREADACRWAVKRYKQAREEAGFEMMKAAAVLQTSARQLEWTVLESIRVPENEGKRRDIRQRLDQLAALLERANEAAKGFL